MRQRAHAFVTIAVVLFTERRCARVGLPVQQPIKYAPRLAHRVKVGHLHRAICPKSKNASALLRFCDLLLLRGYKVKQTLDLDLESDLIRTGVYEMQ